MGRDAEEPGGNHIGILLTFLWKKPTWVKIAGTCKKLGYSALAAIWILPKYRLTWVKIGLR